jgi:hypothetical protein
VSWAALLPVPPIRLLAWPFAAACWVEHVRCTQQCPPPGLAPAVAANRPPPRPWRRHLISPAAREAHSTALLGFAHGSAKGDTKAVHMYLSDLLGERGSVRLRPCACARVQPSAAWASASAMAASPALQQLQQHPACPPPCPRLALASVFCLYSPAHPALPACLLPACLLPACCRSWVSEASPCPTCPGRPKQWQARPRSPQLPPGSLRCCCCCCEAQLIFVDASHLPRLHAAEACAPLPPTPAGLQTSLTAALCSAFGQLASLTLSTRWNARPSESPRHGRQLIVKFQKHACRHSPACTHVMPACIHACLRRRMCPRTRGGSIGCSTCRHVPHTALPACLPAGSLESQCSSPAWCRRLRLRWLRSHGECQLCRSH